MRWLVLSLLLLTAPLTAQRPLFRGGIGLSGGAYNFDSDLGGFDDDATAGLFQAEFEVTSRRGYGGGLRYEAFATDDDKSLFRSPSDPNDRGTQARSASFFGHFTYRIQQHRFAMPVRVGLLFHGLVLDDQGTSNPETTYASLGPMFEIEPELTLVRAGPVRWSIYGQFGVGVAGTAIDVDGDFRDYESDSAFLNLEAGTRVAFGPAEFGLAFIGRYQSMDRSDIEASQFVYGFDAGYQGLLLTAGFRF
ncbi:MAG: outer membrane beta-barrel protein [Planctomycetes bacterium]|nr:outer membrane beta-barrel protein [Planctomycetota bacterium]